MEAPGASARAARDAEMPWRARDLVAPLGPAVGIALTIAMHWLRPELDPAATQVSKYAVGELGWVQGVAFIAVGTGATALALGLYERTRSRCGPGLLLFVAATLVAVTAFPATGETSEVHNAAASLGFVAHLVAMLVLARTFAAEPGWEALALWTRVLAVAGILVALVAATQPAVDGLVQRLLLAIVWGWLVVAGAALERRAGAFAAAPRTLV